MSVLCPRRFFICCGLANVVFTPPSSSTLNTGFQYGPVLSITTCQQSSCFSHSRNCSSSALQLPKRRIFISGSACAGPTSAHTSKNFLCTSIPAQRSCTAEIIFYLLLERAAIYLDKLFHGHQGAISGFLHVGRVRFIDRGLFPPLHGSTHFVPTTPPYACLTAFSSLRAGS